MYLITATVPADAFYQLAVERPARLIGSKPRENGKIDLVFETPDPDATVRITIDHEEQVYTCTESAN